MIHSTNYEVCVCAQPSVCNQEVFAKHLISAMHHGDVLLCL